MTITFAMVGYVQKLAEDFKSTGNIDYTLLSEIILEAKDMQCDDIADCIRQFCKDEISDQQLVARLLELAPSYSPNLALSTERVFTPREK